MKKKVLIENIYALEVIDSRANPTIEVIVEAQNNEESFIVPSGASTGSYEAIELRDNDYSRYNGKGVLNAVKNVNTIIKESIVGMNIYEQEKIDRKLIELDGTENKSRLGANAILGVSVAVAKLAAKLMGCELYEYLGGINARNVPTPMMNIINGGKHANNSLSIQEFMIVPIKRVEFKEKIRMCIEVYYNLKKTLSLKGYSTAVGDEGGFAPNLESDEEAFELIIESIKESKYELGKDICLAIDVASTEMYEEAKKINEDGKYYFWKTNQLMSKEEIIDYYESIVDKYNIISIEDGLAENDWDSWKILNEKIGNKIQIVGDDLFVTNIIRLKKGIENKVANSILIKLNQIGTLTETMDTIAYAKEHGYKVIVSHRSGETEDTTIADLAIGLNADEIKAGAPCRTERVCKYNRIILIESKKK